MSSFFKSRNFQFTVLILLVGFTAFQQGNRIAFEPVKVWDEGSGARNAIEMMQNKQYLVVMHNGQPDGLDVKPPLAVWLKVVSYKLFGINEFAVRFPTIVAFWLIMILFIIFSYRYLKVPYVGWLILLLMAATPGFMWYHVARHGDPDTLLMFFVTGYFLTFFIILEKGKYANLVHYILLGAFITGAAYTKSIAGLAPISGIFVFTILTKSGRNILKDKRIYYTAITTLVIILGYYFIREAIFPGYLKNVLKYELGLFGSYPGTPKHPESSFYINYLWKEAFRPYLYYIPIILIPLLFSKNKTSRRLIAYSFICALMFLLGHSSAVTKNEWYISPIYPFLWLMFAASIYECIIVLGSIRVKRKWLITIIQFLVIFLFGYIGVNNYRNIYKRNYKKPGGYIYEPERMGQYLQEIKTRKPEVKELAALTTMAVRQLEFYIKKYNYEDGTQVKIYRTPDSTMIGQKVFLTDSINQKKLLSTFYVTRVDSAKYGRTFVVDSLKQE